MIGGGIVYDVPPRTGKRVSGYQQPRKQQALGLGWDQSEQFNSYQVRRKQGKTITGKITGHSLNDIPSSNQYQGQTKNQPAYDEYEERMKMKQLYEKLASENPDIPPEELERYMYGYEQQRKASIAQQQQSNNQRRQTPSSNQQFDRRAPIRQKDTMKNILFNGVGVNDEGNIGISKHSRNQNNQQQPPQYSYQQSMEDRRAASRRNNSNLVLGDGYNYFRQEGRR